MKRTPQLGVSSLEFAFGSLVLVPLTLGMIAVGTNMIRTQQTVQLARDAGHMHARGIDFSLTGNKTMLAKLGTNVGLTTSSSTSTAVVILSTLVYVDKNLCASVGAADAFGEPTSACTNYTKWVFTQRLAIGKAAIRSSNYGSPLASGTSGVTIDPTTGKISTSDSVKRSGARATFTGVNPYSVTAGVASGLPSGQLLYLAEASATGFNMAPFVSNAVTYSWGWF